MKLDLYWEKFLSNYIDVSSFYYDLQCFVSSFEKVMPEPENIFAVFSYMTPDNVNCVLLGEDPYPRLTSACGIAFWDKEITSWNDKTNGNSLKNILKGLLTAKGYVNYSSPISQCRKVIAEINFPTPEELFISWLSKGVLLVNTSLTFSSSDSKRDHFQFWKPFQKALITALNKRDTSPYYILWGNKAQKWENEILSTIDNYEKIIKQGHPTFIHQFMDKNDLFYSPFNELIQKTGIEWI